MKTRRIATRLARDESGASAVEFALVAPLLMFFMCGIVSYGGYFWMAHSVQQLANDGARAAISGLDTVERRSIAQQAVTAELADYPILMAADAQVIVDEVDQRLAIRVAYDAAQSPFLVFGGLIPMPSSTIRREASVRLGGY